MNRRDFQIGPGAASLLLIAVVLCMSVLGALSLVSARGDARLAGRGAALAEVSAALDAQAERRFAELDAVLADCQAAADDGAYLRAVEEALPEGMALSDRTVFWQEADGNRLLDCEAEIAPLGGFPRARWAAHRLYTEAPDAYEESIFW